MATFAVAMLTLSDLARLLNRPRQTLTPIAFGSTVAVKKRVCNYDSAREEAVSSDSPAQTGDGHQRGIRFAVPVLEAQAAGRDAGSAGATSNCINASYAAGESGDIPAISPGKIYSRVYDTIRRCAAYNWHSYHAHGRVVAQTGADSARPRDCAAGLASRQAFTR